jgi:hypothetical protein
MFAIAVLLFVVVFVCAVVTFEDMILPRTISAEVISLMHEHMRSSIVLPVLDGNPVSLTCLVIVDGPEVVDPCEEFLADMWFQEEEFVAWGQEVIEPSTGFSELDWVRALTMAEAKEESYQLLEQDIMNGSHSW